MEKKLKLVAILCIIILALIAIYNIYTDYILPKIYDEKSTGEKVTSEDEYSICNSAALKYFMSVCKDAKNVKYFIPSINRNSKKTEVYANNLKNFFKLETYNIYKLAKNVYKVEYKIFGSDSEKYSMIIRLNKRRNYYTVLYDELYDKGEVAKGG